MKKRLFALFLCLCMMMTLLPVGAFAEGTEAQFGLAAGGASVTSVNPVETPDTHITFKFYNGETLLDTQVVNGNGQLTAPATPAIEGGRKFLGWYAVDASGQLEAQEFDFSNAYTNYSGRSEVKVMAKFEAVFYVYFMTVDGQVHSTAIANAASGFKVALPTDYEPKGKVVTGWTANDAVFTADTVVSADTYVYPVTEDCYWVTFNTTGGNMVASCSIKKGDTLNLSTVTVPYRTGYSFKGWSTTADGALISSVTPTADTTLYAVWEGDNVKYMVVYWGENADDNNYSALATATLTGKVGSTVTLDATTGALPNSVSDGQHFKFSRSDSATIRADGSSVLNVYFSRNSYTLTFRKYTWELFGGNYETVATITAKYNASIFAEFGKPPFNTTYNGRAWECTDSSKYNYALQTLDRMPGFDATFDLYDKSSNKLKTIYYYVQNVGTTVNSSRWPTSTANFSLYNEAQYANVSQANGTLTITAKPLTITAGSAEKVYDGQPLTKNSFTNTELAEGDKLTATVTGSQTNVGSSDNVASAAVIMAGEENVTANYTITYENGSLTVTPVTDEVIVTVTERGGDYLYDGGEKVVTGYDAVSSNPLYTANDYSFSGDATVKSTNAGSYDMELAPEDFKNTSANFTNVTFIIVDGKLNIAQRKVLMTSADDEKVYDGTPLTNSTVTVTGDGFAEGEGAAYTVTGSQLDEGSSNNSFTYELNEGTLAANYIIETKEGELTVKPILTEITITANSGEKMYDGSALINGGYTFTSGILVDGDVLTAVVEGSQLNAGSSANVVKSYRVMRGETDVTANYRFAESVDGKLTVTARKVVMTSADDEKVYDGTPLTNDEITVTGDGFIEGEGVTYDVTGSQLDVGSSDNSFTYELNEGTLAENYIIETEEGKLTVTSPEQHIVITANSAEKTYDGTPLTDDGFTYTDFVLAEGDVLEAVVEGSQTDAGSSVNVIKSYRVMRGDEDVTANYIFDDSVDGTLTVTKRKVTLTSGTACKIYDGKYLTCNKVEVGGDGFVEGEGATYDVTGKRKDIGWSYNDFTYKLNDNTKADNYEITVERGFLYVKDQAEKPKTGDSSDLLLLLALMSMSGAGAAGTVYLYRRKREEQE